VNFKDLFQIALLGIVGIAVTNFTYYFTVKESTVATAILVQYTAPVWVMIYAVFVSKNEEFNFIKLLALVFSMTGCFFAVSGGSLGKINLSGWSAVTGICSAFTYAFMILLSKRLTRTYSVWTMLIYAFGFALLFWLTINPPWVIAARGYSTSEWAILWLFAVVSILIPHSLFVLSLKYLEASTAGIASTMEPVVAIVIAYITLGETLNGIQVIGAIVVIVSLLLLQVKKRSVV
jgi:drug/metabolite transporter (DMT)-like permease